MRRLELSRRPFSPPSFSGFGSRKKLYSINGEMSLPNNLEEEFPIVEDSFKRIDASRGSCLAEKVLAHVPSLLDASTIDEANPGASHNEAIRALSIPESQCPRWMNGVELFCDALINKRFLPTGCEGIDTLLGGGLREGQLTEIVGPSSSGKTQICLYVVSHVAVRHFGSIIFLDTSNSFSPTRVASIVNQICRPVDREGQQRIKTIMSRIHCQSVFDIFSLQDALHELNSTLKKQTTIKYSKICMLIVDSVSSLITPILGSKDSQGRSLMVSTGYLMKKLAHEWNLSVLVTNHMVGGEEGTLKPAMGESWKCIPHVRLQLSRDPGSNICIVSVLRHTSMACGRSAEFVITN